MDEPVTINQNDEKTTQSANRRDKVPMFVHLTADQVNQMQAEINANSQEENKENRETEPE